MRKIYIYISILLSLCFSGFLITATGQTLQQNGNLYIPGSDNLPEWIKVGNLHFSRLDGGYIEVQKAKRTKWGQGWNADEYDVLENIYFKYSDNIINKLKQGGINAIWVTWSNGWSLQHEAQQRDNLKIFIHKCHQNDIKVIAYICSSTIFWENMFVDYPVSFDITRKQSSGIPYTYHGENPLRYLANLNHPDWIKLQKKRVEFALDAGIDGFFFDNPLSAEQPIKNQVYFFNEMQKFIKQEKNRSDVPVTSNFGLKPEYQNINRQLDFVFNEFGRQPGVYDDLWICGNIKKIKYVKSFLPSWKTTIHEANYFPGGLRERSFMPPKAQKLARAEAAAFGATYVNFIEGRLLTDLIHDDKEAIEAWNAVGLYNHFLDAHAKYYTNAIQPQRIMILIPDEAEFTFDSMDDTIGPFLDFLSQNNVLYNIKLASQLQPGDIKEISLLILPNFIQIGRSAVHLIESFKSKGGKIIGIGGPQYIRDLSDLYYPWQFTTQITERFEKRDDFLRSVRSLSGSFTLEIKDASHTLGNITTQKDPDRVIIHLINYNDHYCENVSVKANLQGISKNLNKCNIRAISPDFKEDIISEIKIDGSILEIKVPKLDTYAIVVVE